MSKQDEEYMEYIYALEKLQQTTAEIKHYDPDKVKCDWVHLANLLNAAADAINEVMYEVDEKGEKK